MSTNVNISQLFMITYIIVPVAPAVEALFTPNTILLHFILLLKNNNFYCEFLFHLV